MLSFKQITIDDKEAINRYLKPTNNSNCDFSFTSVFCWKHQFQSRFTIVDDFLLLKYICEDGKPCFMTPIGNGDWTHILQLMLNDAKENNFRFRIHAITPEMFEKMNQAMPNTFIYRENRDFFEYIYLASDLISLSGKKFQDKRNHINRFCKSHPNFEYRTLTPDLFPACIELFNQWKNEYRQNHPNDNDLHGEEESTRTSFEYFEALNMRGGSLWDNGKLLAYSYGSPLCKDMFVVHAEKAMHDIPGVFQMMNQQFIKHEASEFSFINREEDMGIESLRKAKMSYNPVSFIERGIVFQKHSENIRFNKQ